MLNDVAVLIAVASFLGAILGAGLSNYVTARLAGQERKENRRKERVASLSDSLNKLIEVRAELQYLNNVLGSEHQTKKQRYYGQAYAIMLSLSDSDILEKAALIVETKSDSNTHTTNALNTIDFGIKRLGEMITALGKE